jgi:hypothetical protein
VKRDAAFYAFPLATTGKFWFLVLGLAKHPRYLLIIRRLISAPNIFKRMPINIGACLDQDLRKHILGGASPSQLFGVDRFGQSVELGFKCVRDNPKKIANSFIEVDIITEDEIDALLQITETWDIVTPFMVLQVYSWRIRVLLLRE